MIKKDDKLEELLKITNITEEEFEKLDFKGKQKYFKAKNRLCKIFFVSKNKEGKGITYRNPEKKRKIKK